MTLKPSGSNLPNTAILTCQATTKARIAEPTTRKKQGTSTGDHLAKNEAPPEMGLTGGVELR